MITKFISPHRHARKTTTPVRLLRYITVKIYSSYTAFRFLFWQKRIAVDFYFQQVFPGVDKCTLVKDFVQKGVSIVKGSLIMSSLFPFLIGS